MLACKGIFKYTCTTLPNTHICSTDHDHWFSALSLHTADPTKDLRTGMDLDTMFCRVTSTPPYEASSRKLPSDISDPTPVHVPTTQVTNRYLVATSFRSHKIRRKGYEWSGVTSNQKADSETRERERSQMRNHRAATPDQGLWKRLRCLLIITSCSLKVTSQLWKKRKQKG